MDKPLLEQAAELRDKARRALRLGAGLQAADQARLARFSDELREQATELERKAAAETARRPVEPPAKPHGTSESRKKGRGGSNEPEPQA